VSKSGGFHVHTGAFGATGLSRVGSERHPERWGVPGELETQPVNPERRVNNLILPDHLKQDAFIANAAPRIPWDEFIERHFVWQRFDDEGNPSGEHVALVGPTGQGKTTLIYHILRLHPFSAVFGTKKSDVSLDKFVAHGFQRFEKWEALPALQVPKRMVWPQPRSLSEMVPLQRAIFAQAIEEIYYEGFWDLVIDEGYYVDEVLKLGALLRLIYTQIRSAGVSIVLATQRPAWVPVEVYDQSTHLFFWRDTDQRNLSRLRELSVSHADAIRAIIPNLEPHQVLYLNVRTGFMCRTRSPKIPIPAGR
jgi:energy-coupling factor transporter ATP-binding protein EcfA2